MTTTPTPDLASLIGRLGEASGPDRELDRDLWAALCANPPSLNPRLLGNTDWPRYTGNLQEAIDLVEKALPGWGWSVDSLHTPEVYETKHKFWAEVEKPGIHQTAACSAIGASNATPAVALLSALLEALSAQGAPT